MTKEGARNQLALHVLALVAILSHWGFIITAFIAWKAQDPDDKKIGLFVMGILSHAHVAHVASLHGDFRLHIIHVEAQWPRKAVLGPFDRHA